MPSASADIRPDRSIRRGPLASLTSACRSGTASASRRPSTRIVHALSSWTVVILLVIWPLLPSDLPQTHPPACAEVANLASQEQISCRPSRLESWLDKPLRIELL